MLLKNSKQKTLVKARGAAFEPEPGIFRGRDYLEAETGSRDSISGADGELRNFLRIFRLNKTTTVRKSNTATTGATIAKIEVIVAPANSTLETTGLAIPPVVAPEAARASTVPPWISPAAPPP